MEEKKQRVFACALCDGHCMACFHADECGDWLDDGSGVPVVSVPQSETAHFQA